MSCNCGTERPLKEGLKTTVCDCFIKSELLSLSNRLASLANKTGKISEAGYFELLDSDLQTHIQSAMVGLQHIHNRLESELHIGLSISPHVTAEEDFEEVPF